jgi:hypothetical protein
MMMEGLLELECLAVKEGAGTKDGIENLPIRQSMTRL